MLVESALVVVNLDVVVFVVVDVHEALSDKEHFLNISLITDDNFTWDINPAQHIDDQVIGEASLALFEEVVERLFEVSESPCALDKFSLHFGRDLLIKLKLLYDQIEIIQESLLNVLSDIIIQSRLNMVRFVRFLNLFDPHIEGVEFFLNKVIKVVLCIEDTVDGSH